MTLAYVKAEPIKLKNHPEFNEKWLQDRIAEDPSILGLGDDVVLVERERTQGQAGRLDLLLSSQEEGRRFEVELMLGATDPSHIIRTIEYWDFERRRYSAYEHTAVLVAEEVTTRFLNVMSLFTGSIPLVVIQLNAIRIGDAVALSFSRVLDSRELRADEDEESAARAPVDRQFWIARSSERMVALADSMLEVIREKAQPALKLNYNRHFVGLNDGTRPQNFVIWFPRRKHIGVSVRIERMDEWKARLEAADLEPSLRGNRIVFRVRPEQVSESDALIRELLHKAVAEHEE